MIHEQTSSLLSTTEMSFAHHHWLIGNLGMCTLVLYDGWNAVTEDVHALTHPCFYLKFS